MTLRNQVGPPDQPDRVVAAPAAAVLDLQGRERRLAAVAPVDGGVVAVDEAGLEQGDEEPLRPAVLALVGAVEGPPVVEGVAEPLHLLEHPLAALHDPVGRPHAAVDRRHLGGQAEGVEAEAEQDGVAAGAAVAGVGVADRVVADVAHVQVARGERARRLDVDRLLPLLGVRGVVGAGPRPGGLALGLDLPRVVFRARVAHHPESSKAAKGRGRLDRPRRPKRRSRACCRGS